MRIVSIVDNLSNKDSVGCEHGLSLYIETAKHKLLFDLGAGPLFSENASRLNVDLKAIDTVVISHGHYDHGGGLKAFLDINDKAKIYIRKEAFRDYYSERKLGLSYIGLDKALMHNPRIIFTRDDYICLDNELELFCGIDLKDERFSLNKNLKIKIGNGYIEDDFKHEQNMTIKSNGKKVLIAGCAHNGITNIIRKSISIDGIVPNYVISGFHLSNPSIRKNESESLIYDLGEKLNKWDIKYYTCHCTGIEPYKMLKQILNDKIDYLAVGEELNI